LPLRIGVNSPGQNTIADLRCSGSKLWGPRLLLPTRNLNTALLLHFSHSPMTQTQPRTGKQIIGRILRIALLAAVLMFALLYIGDYVILRIRIASGKGGTGTVTVRPVYAVPQKDRKTEYIVGDPQQQTCVHSLLPHMNDAPCWYLERHTEPHIDM